MPGSPPGPPPPRLDDLDQQARDWLTARAGSPAGWETALDAAAVNLRHRFPGAIAAAAQCRHPEPVASPAEWAAAGWQPRPGQLQPVWVAKGTGMLRHPAMMLAASQVLPARPGTQPHVPGEAQVPPGADLPGALTAFARVFGYPVTGVPPDPGSPQRVIYVPGGTTPVARAALIAHHLAHIKLGEDGALTADCCGEPAIIADSVAWVVLRCLGAIPAEAGLRFPPPGSWAASPDHMLAAGTRIAGAAAPIAAHAAKLLAGLPPEAAEPAGRPEPAPAPERPAGSPARPAGPGGPARQPPPSTSRPAPSGRPRRTLTPQPPAEADMPRGGRAAQSGRQAAARYRPAAGDSRHARPATPAREHAAVPPSPAPASPVPARQDRGPRRKPENGQLRARRVRREPDPPHAARAPETGPLIAALCRDGRHGQAARQLGRLPAWLIPGALVHLTTADLTRLHQILAGHSPAQGRDYGPAAALARFACERLVTPPGKMIASLCQAGRHDEAATGLGHLPAIDIPAAVEELTAADLFRLYRILAARSPGQGRDYGPAAAAARAACTWRLLRAGGQAMARTSLAGLCQGGRHDQAAAELALLPAGLMAPVLAGLETADLIRVHRTLAAQAAAGQGGDHGPEAGEARDACARILIPRVNEAAAAWFTAQLPDSWAEGYLEGRGVTPAMRQHWELGYAPPGDGQTRLLNYLRSKGWGDMLAVAAGLARRTDTGTLADTFRNRVMIPIRDEIGTLVAFAGRKHPRPAWIKTEAGMEDYDRRVPKYKNTENNVVWTKGEVLYGLWQAGKALAAGGQAVMLEGYSDVWAVDASGRGMLAGVASCGTALTGSQISALAEAARRNGHSLDEVPVLDARDADAAGQKAAARDYPKLIPWCAHPRAAGLPDGADPAEVFEKQGPEALARALTAGDHPLADVAVDALLGEWDRSAARPDGGRLTEETTTAVAAVRAAGRMLAAAGAPADELKRQVARMAGRTGLGWTFTDWAVRPETDPACPQEPPEEPGPSAGQVSAMAERDDWKRPARSQSGGGAGVAGAGFPALPAGRGARRAGRPSHGCRPGHDPPAARTR